MRPKIKIVQIASAVLIAVMFCFTATYQALSSSQSTDGPKSKISQSVNLGKVFEHSVDVTGKFGWSNVSMLQELGKSFSRVRYPAGSYDPGSMLRNGMPVGGVGFRLKLGLPATDCMHLSYSLRFAPDFQFMKGGKLPGLGGGKGNTGGKIPDGSDGFSTRYMWRDKGIGEIYAYLPTSVVWGTSLGRGDWSFIRGIWCRLEQTIRLNTPGRSDGEISVWLNGQLVHTSRDLRFRDTDELNVDQLIFETFFGGNTPDWAPRVDSYIDFADVVVSTCSN